MLEAQDAEGTTLADTLDIPDLPKCPSTTTTTTGTPNKEEIEDAHSSCQEADSTDTATGSKVNKSTRNLQVRDPEVIQEVVRGMQLPHGAVHAYVEAHLEQGPVLEASGRPVGIVAAIAGQSRWIVSLQGEQGHAGMCCLPFQFVELCDHTGSMCFNACSGRLCVIRYAMDASCNHEMLLLTDCRAFMFVLSIGDPITYCSFALTLEIKMQPKDPLSFLNVWMKRIRLLLQAPCQCNYVKTPSQWPEHSYTLCNSAARYLRRAPTATSCTPCIRCCVASRMWCHCGFSAVPQCSSRSFQILRQGGCRGSGQKCWQVCNCQSYHT